MMMELFANRFQDVAERETRCIILPKGHLLPAGEYYFAESFCNDKKCDCRRAFIIATIGFGWENLEFYEEWAHDKHMAPDLKGPVLEFTGPGTKHSENALKLFKEFMMKDKVFLERLKKHYTMFKDTLADDNETDGVMKEIDSFEPEEHTIPDLCKEDGTGFDSINDNNREAFYPLIMAIEETIWYKAGQLQFQIFDYLANFKNTGVTRLQGSLES